MSREQDASIVAFINLIHARGLESEEVRDYKAAHANDRVFQRRAKGAERLVEYKDEILEELNRVEHEDPL